MFDMNADKYPETDAIDKQLDKIQKREWDCLVILDACRYDVLDSISDKKVEPVLVPNTGATPGWLNAVWNQNGWEDVTYVSGHPITKGMEYVDDSHAFEVEERFKKHVPAWKHGNSLHRTTPPEKVYNLAKDEEPPVVAHFVQPHEPFIGDVSIEIRNRDWLPEDNQYPESSPIYDLIKTGDLSPRIVKAAYYENAKLGYNCAQRLKNHFDNLVITADHGEQLGENNTWSHGDCTTEGIKVGRIVGWLEFSKNKSNLFNF